MVAKYESKKNELLTTASRLDMYMSVEGRKLSLFTRGGSAAMLGAAAGEFNLLARFKKCSGFAKGCRKVGPGARLNSRSGRL